MLLSVLLVVALVKASINTAIKGDQVVTAVKENTVLRLRLAGELIERERDNPFEQLGEITPLVETKKMGLNGLLRRIRSASKDDDVKGIYLRFENFRSGAASLQELREALKTFRDSGKFVYAYGENYNQGEYYLASVADKVFLVPEGSLIWKGLSMNVMFFKNTLEKLDIEMQIFRHGKFKSAIEPYILDKMSEANRLQSEVFLGSIWNSVLADISDSRKVSADRLNGMADSLSVRFPEDALGTLIDAVAYEDEVLDELKQKTGRKPDEKMSFVEMENYKARSETNGKTEGRIAVVYANGVITSGDGKDDEVGSIRMVRAIREARTDDKIKAVVLRVNSPGGSALASDVIWREIQLCRNVKPVVVSMGDLAASGGYYISCNASRIFAQPNTITGSIGVFGVLPNVSRMLEKKLGITLDTVNTNKYSDFASGLRPLTPKEQEYIQASVEKVYDTFTRRVAEGRKMRQEEVDSIGQGRVWAGADALKLGLVDELGGLTDAIAYAARQAKISNFRITELPRLRGPFDGLLNNTEREVETKALQKMLGSTYPYFMHMRSLIECKGVQARLPFDIIIN